MSDKEGGFFEQVQGKINPVVVQHYYGPRFEKSHTSFPYLLKVMKAHAVMIHEQGIISGEAAGRILGAMREWDSMTPELDPRLEDLYLNFEHMLAARVGAEICGQLPVARSRNDVEAAMWRMELRETLFALADSLHHMTAVLHARIEETADFVFPGYTYGQQAQPITMGHYLLGVAAAFLRDLERIIACVDRFNRNPLGAAALCGSSYPIDRKLTARLLGFDDVWEHTQDAVVSADYMLEAANTALMSLLTQARLAEDVIYWCSNEAGFADLPNDLIDSSSIMPQKRNPVICATVRAQARIYAGRYAGICAASSVAYHASRDVTVAWEDVLEIIREATGMCLISAEYTKGLIFKKEAMERMLHKGFSNATELSDSLVMQGGLPFRMAHTIVGSAISQLFAAGRGQEDLTWELLNEWSKKVAGRDLPLSKEQVAQAKDFRVDVERRVCQGGTSLKEIQRMAELQRQAKADCEKRFAKRREQWRAADALLQKRASEIADGK